jgi:hypothetical protein
MAGAGRRYIRFDVHLSHQVAQEIGLRQDLNVREGPDRLNGNTPKDRLASNQEQTLRILVAQAEKQSEQPSVVPLYEPVPGCKTTDTPSRDEINAVERLK